MVWRRKPGLAFMVVDNVILNKSAIIERYISRVLEEYTGHEAELSANFTKQDSIILNLERVCQAAIDMAAHIVKIQKLGIPQENRDLFQMLEQQKTIPHSLSSKITGGYCWNVLETLHRMVIVPNLR